MSRGTLPVRLALLRITRGWSQEQLAGAAGIRPASISSYERGKLTPSIKMLHRLVTAMGYTLESLEVAQEFLETLESSAKLRSAEKSLQALAQIEPPTAGTEDSEEEGNSGPSAAAFLARHQEIDHVSVEVGRVATRFTSLFLTLLEPRQDAEGRGSQGSATASSEPKSPKAAAS